MSGREAVTYEQLDRPALPPLPTDRYVLARWNRRCVDIDNDVSGRAPGRTRSAAKTK